MEPTLSQALHLLNGDTVHGKIQQGGLITKLLDAEKKPPRESSKRSTSAACPASRPPTSCERLLRSRQQAAELRSKAWKTSSGPC